MPPENSSEFAAILAEMKAIKKGLSKQLEELGKKVDGIAADVTDVRAISRKLFEAWLEQEVRMAKVEKKQELLEARVRVLEGEDASPASSTEPS